MGLNKLQGNADEYYLPNKLEFRRDFDTSNLREYENYQLQLLLLSSNNLYLNTFNINKT